MKSPIFAGILLSMVAGIAGCGEDNPTTIDARPIRPDAAVIDAPPIDAAGPVFGGTVSLLEVSVLNPGTSGSAAAQGPSFSAVFNDVTLLGTPVFDEIPGSTLGCKAWNLTAAQSLGSLLGTDQGAISITSTGTAPVIPGCGYGATTGYVCPDTASASTGGIIGPSGMPGLGTLTDTDNTFTDANALGRYVKITGAATASNNGAFPIVQRASATTVVFFNPGFAAETLPATAVHINIAAIGPIPSAADPGFIADDAGITIAHVAGGGNKIPAFSVTSGAAGVGNDFTLDVTELNKLNAIPFDGSALTITCSAAQCPAGSATANTIQITSTDAVVSPASPFSMPPPVTSSVRIQCGGLALSAGGSITVPAAAMALLKNATGITRVRASFSRLDLMSNASVPASISVFAGHTIIGFSAPTAPPV